MNDKMSQAIAAARSGQSQKAQALLAQILKADQSNVNAWFLLSHLVDDPAKKTAFLKRILALDPSHQKAQQALTVLEPKPEPVEELATVGAEPQRAAVPEPQPQPVIATSDPIPNVAEEPDIDKEAAIEEQETAYNLEDGEEETAVPMPIISSESDDLLAQADSNTLPSWLQEDDEILTPEDLAAEALPDFTDSVAIEDLPDWLTKTNIDDWTAEKPWEQAEESLDIDFDDEPTDELESILEPEPEIIKSAVDIAAEQQDSMPQPATISETQKPVKRTNDRTLNIILTILIIVAFFALIGLIYIVITGT